MTGYGNKNEMMRFALELRKETIASGTFYSDIGPRAGSASRGRRGARGRDGRGDRPAPRPVARGGTRHETYNDNGNGNDRSKYNAHPGDQCAKVHGRDDSISRTQSINCRNQFADRATPCGSSNAQGSSKIGDYAYFADIPATRGFGFNEPEGQATISDALKKATAVLGGKAFSGGIKRRPRSRNAEEDDFVKNFFSDSKETQRGTVQYLYDEPQVNQPPAKTTSTVPPPQATKGKISNCFFNITAQAEPSSAESLESVFNISRISAAMDNAAMEQAAEHEAVNDCYKATEETTGGSRQHLHDNSTNGNISETKSLRALSMPLKFAEQDLMMPTDQQSATRAPGSEAGNVNTNLGDVINFGGDWNSPAMQAACKAWFDQQEEPTRGSVSYLYDPDPEKPARSGPSNNVQSQQPLIVLSSASKGNSNASVRSPDAEISIAPATSRNVNSPGATRQTNDPKLFEHGSHTESTPPRPLLLLPKQRRTVTSGPMNLDDVGSFLLAMDSRSGHH